MEEAWQPAAPNAPFVSQYLGHYRVYTGGWVECFSDEGDAYYYNEHTGESEWELPEGCREVLPALHDTQQQQQVPTCHSLRIHVSLTMYPAAGRDGLLLS